VKTPNLRAQYGWGEGLVKHTRSIGCRSLDILHVASALELEIRHFATFDTRQQQLARAAGLRVIVPSP
jgi:predicted nucleic acid-binding protein